MNKFAYSLAAIAVFACSPVQGDTLNEWANVYHSEHVEGVYYQNWHAMHLLVPSGFDAAEVYVRGEGKLGSFHGVLYIDCEQPKFSKWLAVPSDDYGLDENQVSSIIIAMARERFCYKNMR